jgi:tetratricopeptide (TPR) repeat protein
MRGMRDSCPVHAGDAMSLPSLAEVEHADWPSLQQMCSDIGLNPKGRSAIVRMRVADHVRRRSPAPSWRPAREHQAALLLRLNHPDLAVRVWESTIHLDAPAPWVGLGYAQVSSGHFPEAAKSFSRATAMGDPSGDLHRAEALAAGGSFEEAAQAFDRFLATRPGDLRGLLMKASFLKRAGFEEESTKVLRTAVDLHPEAQGLRRTLGRSLLQAGHPAAAADALQEAARQDSNDLDTMADEGVALLLAGRTREAIDVLRETLGRDPERADALNNLGIAYLSMGNRKSAATNLKRAAKQFESPRILLNLGKTLEGTKNRAEAVRAYEQALRLRPEDPEALAGRDRLARLTKGTSANPKKAEGKRTKTAKPTKKKSTRPKDDSSPPPSTEMR